jgi:T5SS/PEP-CTERM-associated repeat protein
MRKMTNTAVAMAIMAGYLLAGGTAKATDYYWNNTGGGTYGTAGNWNPSGPPPAADNAYFTSNASYTVTWGASAAASNAAFNAPGGAVTLDTGANTWSLSGGLNLANTMTLKLNKGTLTTGGGSTLNYATDFNIGGGAADNTFTWNITGGTTTFDSAGAASETANALHIGNVNSPGGRGILNISGASTVVNNDNWLHIGRGNAGSGNQLNITGGAKLNTGGSSYIGYQGGLGSALVDGTGSVWTVGWVVVGKNGTGNSLIVTNGGKLVSGLTVGETSYNQALITGPGSSVTGSTCNVGQWYGATGNKLTVEKGATAWFAGNVGTTYFGKDASGVNPASQSNSIVVTGAGSTFAVTGAWAYVQGINTSFRVRDGGSAYIGGFPGDGSVAGGGTVFEVADTGSALSVYSWNVHSVSLIVTNGGSFVSRAGTFYLGQSSGSAASVLVRDPGSSLSVTGSPFRVGAAANSTATITVENGGRFIQTDDSNWGLSIGYGAGSAGSIVVAGAGSEFGRTGANFGAIAVGGSGARLVVTNQGTFWTYSRSGLSVGWAPNCTSNTVLVADGGLLDFRKNPDNQAYISVSNQVGNVVSNIGGIFQFVHANPVVAPGAFGNVVIDGGTVSFKDINTADVRCNQSGYGMDSATRVQWLGANGFRLNAAMNINNANQAYTFANTLGPANFARLELINGAQWRGGTATIGSGGKLVVGTGTNTVGAGVAFASGGSLAVTFNGPGQSSYLQASGATVNVNNATLGLTLGAAPQKDVPYPILGATGGGSIAGSFQSNELTASYGGTNYVMTVRSSGGTVSIVWASKKGTLIRFL